MSDPRDDRFADWILRHHREARRFLREQSQRERPQRPKPATPPRPVEPTTLRDETGVGCMVAVLALFIVLAVASLFYAALAASGIPS